MTSTGSPGIRRIKKNEKVATIHRIATNCRRRDAIRRTGRPRCSSATSQLWSPRPLLLLRDAENRDPPVDEQRLAATVGERRERDLDVLRAPDRPVHVPHREDVHVLRDDAV